MTSTASTADWDPETTPAGHVSGSRTPGLILRAEGALLLVSGVTAFAYLDFSWWLFAALLLAPDVGLAGYLAGPRVGAASYNLTHTLVVPLGLGLAGLSIEASTLMAIAAIWVAHIGMDRAAGFGLKYSTGFRDTHLQRVLQS